MANNLYLEEVASDCIEVEVDTNDNMLLLEPLRDHNYILKTENELANNTTQIVKLNKKRNLDILPKMPVLSALYNCRLCGFMTMNKLSIVAHRSTHKDVQLVNTKKLRSKSIDIKPKTYKCPKCSYVSKKSSSLKLHMHIHSKGAPYKCKECNYAGKELKDLVNHYKNAENQFCDLCPYCCHWKEQFIAHLKTHTMQRLNEAFSTASAVED